MITHRKATPEDLERVWNYNIEKNPGDVRWLRWKKEYIGYNERGEASTFVVLCDREPIGEGTLLFSPKCRAIRGRTVLADGATVANINALRIRGAFEGQGYISALVRLMERYARENGCERLTIGVEAKETRNLAIYFHLGYVDFVMSEIEDGELVLYYEKILT